MPPTMPPKPYATPHAKGPDNLSCPGPHIPGGDEGIRTLGLCHATAALSQLSYVPKRNAQRLFYLARNACQAGNSTSLKRHVRHAESRGTLVESSAPWTQQAPRATGAPDPKNTVAPRGCDNEPTSQKVGALTAFSSFPNNGGYLYCGRNMGSQETLVGSPSLHRRGQTTPLSPSTGTKPVLTCNHVARP